METPPPVDDFDVAKTVSEKLKGLDKDRQERILRWVAEGLGLSMTTPAPALGAAIITPASVTPEQVRSQPSSGLDIKTFVASKAPKSDNQFAATVAYYYRFEAPPADRRNHISGDMLQEAARLAGRKRLGNPRNTLNNAKQAGYLDSGTPGEFSINSVGENLVAMALPGGTEVNSSSSRKRRALKGRTKKSETTGR